jgi:hypothetical protein
MPVPDFNPMVDLLPDETGMLTPEIMDTGWVIQAPEVIYAFAEIEQAPVLTGGNDVVLEPIAMPEIYAMADETGFVLGEPPVMTGGDDVVLMPVPDFNPMVDLLPDETGMLTPEIMDTGWVIQAPEVMTLAPQLPVDETGFIGPEVEPAFPTLNVPNTQTIDTTVIREMPVVSTSDTIQAPPTYVVIPVNEIHGTKFVDNIVGTDGADFIASGNGSDKLFGGISGDILEGGKGADRLDGGAGIDTVTYANSDAGVNVNFKTGFGSGGEAIGDRYTNVENAIGSNHNDTFQGNNEANSFEGLAGNDTFKGDLGADTFNGGEGNDSVTYAHSKEGVQVTLEEFSYKGGARPTDEILQEMRDNFVNGHGGDAEGDHFISIENVTGSKFADHLTGNDSANIIDGGKGNDTIDGGRGDDVLTGGKGDDTFVISFGGGNDVITDFAAGARSGDKIEIHQVNDGTHAPLTFDDLMSNAHQEGANLVFDFGDNQHLTLNNVMMGNVTENDFNFVLSEAMPDIPMSAGPVGGGMPPEYMG